jgi:hypothetical protein
MFNIKAFLTTCCLILSIGLFAQEATHAVIGGTDVKMRSQANSNSELLGKCQLGEVAKILEISNKAEHIAGINDDASCNEYNWYKLTVNGKTGWVFGAFVFEMNTSKEIYSSKTETIIGTISNFYARASGQDMCYGENFLAMVPNGEISKVKNVRLIKVNKTRPADYRGMPSLGFDMDIQQIVHANDGIIAVVVGGSAPGDYQEIRVLELKSDGNNGYNATEKYFNATR